MSKWHLYPNREVVGQDFSNEKTVTVPNQSMTLKEILRRFVRRESLPIQRQGIYAEGFGDLEKIMHEDFTVQEERLNEVRKKVEYAKKKSSEKADAKGKAAKAKASETAGETDSPAAGSGADPAGSASEAE